MVALRTRWYIDVGFLLKGTPDQLRDHNNMAILVIPRGSEINYILIIMALQAPVVLTPSTFALIVLSIFYAKYIIKMNIMRNLYIYILKISFPSRPLHN